MKEFILELILGYTAYAWLLLALGFLLLELSTPGLFFFIAFACGAVCAAAMAFLDFSIIGQLWIALLGSVTCFIAIKSFFATHKTKNTDNKTNVDALIGQEAIVVEAISINQPGAIRVKRELWSAILRDGSMLQIGTVVKIVDIQGNKLVVRSL
jgi:membrane protein implicated in regulation of membrane protease activity